MNGEKTKKCQRNGKGLEQETDVSFNGACPAFDFPARGDGIPLASLDGCSIRIGYLLTLGAVYDFL